MLRCDHPNTSLDRDWLDRPIEVCDGCGSHLSRMERGRWVQAPGPADEDQTAFDDADDAACMSGPDDSFAQPSDWVYGERC